MGFENYISEDEAASMAGVTVSTLTRFAEAGYLGIETESDGLRMFSKREIVSTFGLSDSQSSSPNALSRKIEVQHTSQSEPDLTAPSLRYERDTKDNKDQAVLSKKSSEDQPEKIQTQPRHKTKLFEHPVENAHAQDSQNTHEERSSITEQEAQHSKSASTEDSPSASDQLGTLQRQQAEDTELSNELRRLRATQELYEKLVDFQDQQIESLKGERDWLRSRVEQFEAERNRNQILLLTETQLLRQMISERTENRSPLRKALEWFGLIEPNSNKTQKPRINRTTIQHE